MLSVERKLFCVKKLIRADCRVHWRRDTYCHRYKDSHRAPIGMIHFGRAPIVTKVKRTHARRLYQVLTL